MDNTRHSDTRHVVGGDLFSRVSNARVLVVGAGGIGCELLKNLVMGGFLSLEVIDLDTIDVSNLNRQFLFRKRHVGQSKALVAHEMVSAFNPQAKIVSHHGDIKDPKFGTEYFSKFDLVFNALDNLGARMHVNRMCLQTNVPLIESGTRGYLGQVQVIKKGVTECYECTEKVTPKQIPICTIRNNPSTIVHCVAWAKYLFSLLFGEKDPNNALSDGEKQVELTTPEQVFSKFFNEAVQELGRMDDLWKTKAKPVPLDLGSFVSEDWNITSSEEKDSWVESLADHQVWQLGELAKCFVLRCNQLFAAHNGDGQSQVFLSFDKDDALAMDFVTAAANLRAHCFHIPLKTRFDIKEVAGNIVPAIATTNAIVAGLMVTEAYKVLQDAFSQTRFIYCNRNLTGKCLLVALPHNPPNPRCYVCSSQTMELHIDTSSQTLGFFVEKVLKERLNLNHPTVATDEGSILFEEGEGLDEDEVETFERLASQTLAQLKLTNKIVTCSDLQELQIKISILHKPLVKVSNDDDQEAGFQLVVNAPATVQAKTAQAANGENGHTTNGANRVEQDDPSAVLIVNKKRKRSANEPTDDERPAKKFEAEVIEIE